VLLVLALFVFKRSLIDVDKQQHSSTTSKSTTFGRVVSLQNLAAAWNEDSLVADLFHHKRDTTTEATETASQEQRKPKLPDSYFTYTGRHGLRSLVFPELTSSSWNSSQKPANYTAAITSIMFGSERGRSNSLGSDEGSHPGKPLEEPILVYHESARSIVFRDHLRRAVKSSNQNGTVNNIDHEESIIVERGRVPSEHGVAGEFEEYTHLAQEIFDPSETTRPLQAGLKETQIAGFQPRIVPLSPLELGPNDEYLALMESTYDDAHMAEFSEAEREVCEMLQQQKCTVKTIKNVDWTPFLQRFQNPVSDSHTNSPREHGDHAADGDQYPFNSFVTSCSMLPTNGLKMRSYGSPNQYTVGVVFALPNEYVEAAAEDEAAARTQTWSWPAGYSVSFVERIQHKEVDNLFILLWLTRTCLSSF